MFNFIKLDMFPWCESKKMEIYRIQRGLEGKIDIPALYLLTGAGTFFCF